MPHFCNCGADTYICQSCATVFCSRENKPSWEVVGTYPDGTPRLGNKCENCANAKSPNDAEIIGNLKY